MEDILLLNSDVSGTYKRTAKRKLSSKKENREKIEYLSRVVYQAILPSVHTPFTGINTFHFDTIVLLVSCGLFSFSLLRRLAVYVVLWEYFFILGLCNLGSLSTLQKGGILCYYLVLELLDILQFFPLFLLFYKPLPFSFFLCFGLCLSSCLLSYTLYTTSLHYFFQVD